MIEPNTCYATDDFIDINDFHGFINLAESEGFIRCHSDVNWSNLIETDYLMLDDDNDISLSATKDDLQLKSLSDIRHLWETTAPAKVSSMHHKSFDAIKVAASYALEENNFQLLDLLTKILHTYDENK